LQFTINVR